MITTDHLLALARRYSSHSGLKLSTLSTHIFDDGKKIAAIEAGADLGSRRLAMAIHWFADRWPDDLDWPEGIERPSRAAA